MPSDFQVICGSMVSENRRSPASTEIPAIHPSFVQYFFCVNKNNLSKLALC